MKLIITDNGFLNFDQVCTVTLDYADPKTCDIVSGVDFALANGSRYTIAEKDPGFFEAIGCLEEQGYVIATRGPALGPVQHQEPEARPTVDWSKIHVRTMELPPDATGADVHVILPGKGQAALASGDYIIRPCDVQAVHEVHDSFNGLVGALQAEIEKFPDVPLADGFYWVIDQSDFSDDEGPVIAELRSGMFFFTRTDDDQIKALFSSAVAVVAGPLTPPEGH